MLNSKVITDFILEELFSKEESENNLDSMESITLHDDCSWFDYYRKVSGEDLVSLHAYVNQLPYMDAAVELAEWATSMDQDCLLD